MPADCTVIHKGIQIRYEEHDTQCPDLMVGHSCVYYGK